jgi:SSS family solute:Na+ symporter
MVVISVMTKMAFCLFAGTLVLNGLVGWGVMKVVVWLGITSKRITVRGAIASFVVGFLAAAVYVTDQLIGMIRGPEAAKAAFPILHHTLTANYTWRGLWGTILIIAVLFIVSAFTKRAAEEKLATTTVDWRAKWAPFEGWRDWRLQLAVLSAITVFLYWRMW